MKKESIIWQIIVVLLGLSLILIVGMFLNNKNQIEALTNRSICVLKVLEKDIGAMGACEDILKYKAPKLKINKI